MGLLILALQIRQSDSEIAHGHVWRAMPEEFHDAGKAYAGAEHECGIGMSELMRDDPRGDSRRGGDFVQRFADSTKQHLPSVGPRQKEAIGWRGVKRTQSSEALNELADE